MAKNNKPPVENQTKPRNLYDYKIYEIFNWVIIGKAAKIVL